MKNNYLILITNHTLIEKLKEESHVTFLFPIKGFSVGFPEVFTPLEIKSEGAYIFINRILDHEGIRDFKKLLATLPDHIKGIVFDDIGILQVLKEFDRPLVKILFLNHFNCNSISVNSYLEDCDSVVVSSDLTFDETEKIVKKAKKPVVLFTFGYVNIMYSRRKLITNYNEYFKKNASKVSEIANDLKQTFKVVENEYGTVVYTGSPFNGLKYRELKPVLFHMIQTLFLEDKEVLDILHAKSTLDKKYPYKYLSEHETIVRIKER